MTDEVRGKLAALARAPGHRPPERRRVQGHHQELPGDRPGAGRGLPAGRQGALGEGRQRPEPGAGEPRADRGRPARAPDGSSRSTRCSPTSSRCRGRSPGKVAQALDLALGAPERERAGGAADPEPRRVRRLPPGRGGVASGWSRSSRPPWSAPRRPTSGRSRWTRASCRRGPGSRRSTPAATSTAFPPRRGPRGLARRPSAPWPWHPTPPSRRLALGSYYDFITGEYAKALEQFALGRRADPNNAELLSACGAVGAEPGALGERARLPEAGRSPRPALAAGGRPPGPELPLAAPARRGHRRRRPGHRAGADHRLDSSAQGDGAARQGRSPRRPGRAPRGSRRGGSDRRWSPRSPTTGTWPGCWTTSSRSSSSG